MKSDVLPGSLKRPPSEVMRPEVLGAMQPTHLSFSRSLLRRMVAERWSIERVRFDIDRRGEGEACYRVDTGQQTFDFVLFASEPQKEGRTPRIIGKNWDVMCALLEGVAEADRVEQTRRELPKLYAGRAAPGTLTWGRANQSLRAFGHVVERLSNGQQPDIAVLGRVCYLMRNAGLDANGTFGTRSFLSYGPDHPLTDPYQAQMLSAYLMREFSFDLADESARMISSDAVPLDPRIRRFLGLGNASGLGLVLWVNSHPVLVNQWIDEREEALAKAKRLPGPPDGSELTRLLDLLHRCIRYRREDRITYSSLTPSAIVASELSEIVVPLVEELLSSGTLNGHEREFPLAELCEVTAGSLDVETRETLNAILIDLLDDGAAPERVTLASELLTGDPTMSLPRLREILHEQYSWAFDLDLETAEARRYVWYKSADAEEPRRGPAEEVPPGFDLSLDLPGGIVRLDATLRGSEAADVGSFLLRHPAQRAWVERVQALASLGYHSPHMNMRADDFLPVHIIRLVNSGFYGIDKTKDYRGRIVRGVLLHGAPTRQELATGDRDGDWHFPSEPAL